jgi:hypothetical protein
MKLPIEIMEAIALYANDKNTTRFMKKFITKKTYIKIMESFGPDLLYGNIQSGKTKKIISYINLNNDCVNVLVVQNSLAVMKQYAKRLAESNIKFQIISKDSKSIEYGSVAIVMANKHRYAHFMKLNVKFYNLIVDEADSILKLCPLKGFMNLHVTATPNTLKRGIYETIYSFVNNENYIGIGDINAKSSTIGDATNNFLKTKSGIMLINQHNRVDDMYKHSIELSLLFTKVPIIFLTSVKLVLLNGIVIVRFNNESVSEMIDYLYNYTHIFIVADRISKRGVSFTSSNYKKHLTAQHINKTSRTSTLLMQKLRILGIYEKNTKLVLTISHESFNEYGLHIYDHMSFDMNLLRKNKIL